MEDYYLISVYFCVIIYYTIYHDVVICVDYFWSDIHVFVHFINLVNTDELGVTFVPVGNILSWCVFGIVMYRVGARFVEVDLLVIGLVILTIKIYIISFCLFDKVCIIYQNNRLIVGYNVYLENLKEIEKIMKLLDENSSNLFSIRFNYNDSRVYMDVKRKMNFVYPNIHI